MHSSPQTYTIHWGLGRNGAQLFPCFHGRTAVQTIDR